MIRTPTENPPWPRVIAHVDMDAFYAAVELLDHPELAGRPLVVGGRGRGGIVTTASYEARRFGVHSAMPMFLALQKCPHAVVLPVRLHRYREVSEALMRVLERFSPRVRATSLDEASLDLSGTEHLFGTPHQTGERIRSAILDHLGLTASVGIAAGRVIAKIASDWRKPDGLTVVPPHQAAAFLAPLSVRRIPGVGPKTAERLERYNLRTMAEVRATDVTALRRIIGSFAPRLHALAHGEDLGVVPEATPRRTVGAERTFREDLSHFDDLMRALRPLADRVARELRERELHAGGVRLKLKTRAFKSFTRELQLPGPTQSAEPMLRAVETLLRPEVERGPFRLAGLAATALRTARDGTQLPLDLDGDTPSPDHRAPEVDEVVHAIQRKFGANSLRRASRLPHGTGKRPD